MLMNSDMTKREVHLFDHNNTNGTWCQGHAEKLLVDCRTILYTILHKQIGNM